MDNYVWLERPDRFRELSRLNAYLMKLNIVRNILQFTSCKVINYKNLVSTMKERVDDMRSDKPRPSSYKCPCHDCPL